MTNTPQQPAKPRKDNDLATSADSIPDFARTVLVPIANPNTAADLLHLAAALAHPENGKLFALIVSTGDVESSSNTAEELEHVVEEVREEGTEITLEMVTATSIARGILDASRQFGADLIIIGAQKPARGEVRLGKIVESVLDTAACDVMVYRLGYTPDFRRVVVPVDTSYRSQVSARMGIRLADNYGTPVEAMHVQGSNHSQFEGLARIEEAISSLPNHRKVRRTVVTAQDEVEGVLSRTGEDDLIIVGFDPRTDFEKYAFGDIAGGLLNRAPGPVILVSRAIGRDTTMLRQWRRFLNWMRPTLTSVEQDDIIRNAQINASLTLDYTVLIIVSAALATLGLLQNSAAVIIGAMLVAPLMSPLISFSSGLAVGRVKMTGNALMTLAIGVGTALLVSIILGLLLPTATSTTEMLARGRPTLVDAGIAFASGVVGAYATARKDIPAALAGVAIAAALMPPICTVGLGFAFGELDLAFGAGILFMTNIICIILAGMGVFLYLGMNLTRFDDVRQSIQIAALVLFLVAAIPVYVQLVELTRDASQASDVRSEIETVLDRAELVDVEFREADPLRVIVTVRSPNQLTYETAILLENNLTNILGEDVRVDLVVLPVVRFNVDAELTTEDGGTDDPVGAEAQGIEGEFAVEVTPEVTPAVEE